jgi:hypothetical protein
VRVTTASLLMFAPNYLRHLIEIGEEDIDARLPELHAFFGKEPAASASA